jgi:hypothetical protein
MIYVGTDLILDARAMPENADTRTESRDDDQDDVENNSPPTVDESEFLPDSKGNYTYIFSPSACESVLGNIPENVVEPLKNTDWFGDNYRSITVNSQGDLEIILNESDKKIWEEYQTKIIQGIIEKTTADENSNIIISEDYKRLEYMANRKSHEDFSWNMMFIIQCMNMLQVLEGTPPEQWSISVVLRNIDTGNVVWERVFPLESEESLYIEEDVWDG